MPTYYIVNCSVILEDSIINNSSVTIKDDKIIAIGQSKPKNALQINARGSFVSPGFIDSHIHGTPGKIFKNEIRHGTTSIVPAISCGSTRSIFEKVDKIKDFINNDPMGKNVLGIRLEGPYISRKKAGAQDKKFIKDFLEKELSEIINKCGPLLKMVTFAPEVKRSKKLIDELAKRNIIPSIGHSNAKYEETEQAIGFGARHVTHMFNALRGVDANDPGAASAVLLDDRVAAELILDMIHVRKPLARLLTMIKDKNKIILVTDSIKAEPMGAKRRGGVYKLKDNTIAGSSLTMIRSLENAVKTLGIPLQDAVRFMTINPARLFGIARHKGSIAVGKDADLSIFDRNFNIKMTIIHGKIMHNKLKFKCQ